MSDNPTGCDNYTQVPNSFFDQLLGEINSMSEMKVTLCLIRKIYGWHKENDPEGDLVSFSQFIEVTKLSRPMVKQGLDAGVKRGSILRVECGQSFSYRLNLSDYQGEAPVSLRGTKLEAARQARCLNQFREQTSLDNTPVSGLENKPATGLENKHTKETELKKDLNKSSVVAIPPPEKKDYITTRPVKSEAILIEEYFLLATTGTTGFMSANQRAICKDLEAKGMTLERCKPGIDQTIAEMNAKGKVCGSISLCIPAIYQLDKARSTPTSITAYQKPKPFEQPVKVFTPESYGLTPRQQQILDAKRAKTLAENEYFERMDRQVREQEAANKQQSSRLQA